MCYILRWRSFWPLTGMDAGLFTTTTSSSMCTMVIGWHVTGTSCLKQVLPICQDHTFFCFVEIINVFLTCLLWNSHLGLLHHFNIKVHKANLTCKLVDGKSFNEKYFGFKKCWNSIQGFQAWQTTAKIHFDTRQNFTFKLYLEQV